MPADVMTPNSVLNTRKLHECDMNAACVDVTTANVALGIRVRRGRVWNKKWRDDLDDSSAANPRPRLTGTVVGFTDAGGALVGRNSGREFATDCITEASGPGWAVVEWLPSSSPTPPHARKRSVYPIGFMGAYSLVFADAPEDRGAVDAVDVGELYRSALEGGRPTMDEVGFTDAQRDFYEFG